MPSRWTWASVSQVAVAAAIPSFEGPKATTTWFSTTSLRTRTPGSADSRSAMRRATRQWRATISATPARPSRLRKAGSAIRRAKARVIATVSSAEKAAVARAAGAHEVLDYKSEDVAERIKEITGGAGVTRIVEVEFGGNLETSLAVIGNNGVIASYASDAVLEPALPFYRLAYGNTTLRPVLVFAMPEDAKLRAIADITRWAESGELSHHIGPRFALEDTAAAHQAVEAGAFGKVVIELSAL